MATRKKTTTTAVLEPKRAERREAPRLKLSGVVAEIVSLGVSAKVLDIGFGGLSIESEREFRTDEVHTVRAGTSGPNVAALRVRAKHCRRTRANGRPCYVTGFEFVDPWCPGDRSAADEFISQVTRGVSKATRE